MRSDLDGNRSVDPVSIASSSGNGANGVDFQVGTPKFNPMMACSLTHRDLDKDEVDVSDSEDEDAVIMGGSRQGMRRRSLSLTSQVTVPGNQLKGDPGGDAPEVAIGRLRTVSTSDNLCEVAEAIEANDIVPLRAVSGSSNGISKSSDTLVDEDYAVVARGSPCMSQRRPSSVLIHENEELLRIADELHIRDLTREAEEKMAAAKERALQTRKPSGTTALVRRNSSGYSSGGSNSHLNRTAKSKVPAPASGKAVTLSKLETRKATASSKNDRRGSVTPTNMSSSPTSVSGAKPLAFNFPQNPRRSSMMVNVDMATPNGLGKAKPISPTKLNSQGKSSRMSFGSIFGSGSNKRNSLIGGGQTPNSPSTGSRGFAKRFDRQVSQQSNYSNDEKRAQFTQVRASTGLNLFNCHHGRRLRRGHAGRQKPDRPLAGRRTRATLTQPRQEESRSTPKPGRSQGVRRISSEVPGQSQSEVEDEHDKGQILDRNRAPVAREKPRAS